MMKEIGHLASGDDPETGREKADQLDLHDGGHSGARGSPAQMRSLPVCAA